MPQIETNKNDLTLHWLIVGLMVTVLIIYLVFCHLMESELRLNYPAEQRETIRTIFYIIGIIGFPLSNLIRHIQLRLNQTMPGKKSAKNRYLLTIAVSMIIAESIGVLGVVMYMLGDDFNTLYIFSGLSFLAMFLYRPKLEEYQSIVDALRNQNQ